MGTVRGTRCIASCAGTEMLAVDFEGEGLTIHVRDGAAAAIVLTAPAQGLTFVEPGVTATIKDHLVTLTNSDGSVRTCLPQSKG